MALSTVKGWSYAGWTCGKLVVINEASSDAFNPEDDDGGLILLVRSAAEACTSNS